VGALISVFARHSFAIGFRKLRAAGFLLCWWLAQPCGAHTPSETYLSVRLDATNLTLRWDVALRDLHHGMGLDARDVPKIHPAELQRREEALALDTASALALRADGNALKLEATDYTTLPLNGVEYARLILVAGGLVVRPEVVEIDAAAVFRLDTNMHGLLRLEHDGRVDAVAFNREQATHRFQLARDEGALRRWRTFIWEGVWHIWIGFDHILFLVALLLPAVLWRKGKRWVVADDFRAALVNVLKIVTAFTVAHSVTLSLAALGVVSLPSRLVESVIAVSVALAAANNLWPVTRGKSWMVAGAFGLIHGFGFASVLGELGLESGGLAVALAGFNIGVELGQLAIVSLFLPVAFALRRTWFYRAVAFQMGSVLVIIMALVWMAERIFGLTI
jgi:HupE / UreJ protein